MYTHKIMCLSVCMYVHVHLPVDVDAADQGICLTVDCRYCCLENEADERHPMNQDILYNHGTYMYVDNAL